LTGLQIKEVKTKADRRIFVEYPNRLYADNKYFVPAFYGDDIDDWDSLNHITLMAAVEDEFGIRFTMGEVSGMKNVGEMAQIIKDRA